MANIKSAIKRIKITARNRKRNLVYKDAIRKGLKAALKTKSTEDIRKAIKALDKAASKKVISKNLASRKKSKLMKLTSSK
ncbi:hypothetical protein A2230_01555 [candidate division WOR-1 bacterium RIFOXYA2_FULL_36_21]|uniref:Small ribosomal subunit protein bS20 n=1 Tax=candidate division WOR-1 bacterium RIFOXYB2_FULL_36_35 TaxID=1802578 RepID=A0A1F4S7A5_UNCSA|nr:MAG: hypothetical protein A2230_01555 [candidate division WOR-1 bacterium RIFOXYA2_FULL_36_21]OGC15703.1 MAG: hypothetical protein A2282_04490 [candidate division WOR-1 bacterium RIFOXYA12_FULL_36_13]OGC16299.1 MAG: hypothetical protein A2290_04280 [candidate division WOR-1 bacterium RIFOXYB2_FULL_36_35]